MAAVKAVRQVVHALWALSRAQLPLVEQAVAEASLFLDWVDEIVERLAGRPTSAGPGETLHVVIGPERGYAGSLARRMLACVPPEGALGLVGQRLADAAHERPELARRVLFTLPAAVTHDEADELAQRVAEALLGHARTHHVELHYPRAGEREPTRVVLLAGAREPAADPPDSYSPIETLLAAAVHESVAGRITVGLIEALRAEIMARIAAVDRARLACDAKLEELEHAWRQARQERITNELLESGTARLAATSSTR